MKYLLVAMTMVGAAIADARAQSSRVYGIGLAGGFDLQPAPIGVAQLEFAPRANLIRDGFAARFEALWVSDGVSTRNLALILGLVEHRRSAGPYPAAGLGFYGVGESDSQFGAMLGFGYRGTRGNFAASGELRYEVLFRSYFLTVGLGLRRRITTAAR
jgi:hypothetical protein